MHGGVSRNIVEDIANVELQPTFIGLVDDTGAGADVCLLYTSTYEWGYAYGPPTAVRA